MARVTRTGDSGSVQGIAKRADIVDAHRPLGDLVAVFVNHLARADMTNEIARVEGSATRARRAAVCSRSNVTHERSRVTPALASPISGYSRVAAVRDQPGAGMLASRAASLQRNAEKLASHPGLPAG
jgi:hypothetical protein